MKIQALNLPTYPLKIKRDNEQSFVFDIFRLKWLRLTPEEWVRQNFAYYLMLDKHYPKGRLSLEYGLKINSLLRRCDIVFFSDTLKPELIVECKAPNININQKVFDQIVKYNFELKVTYLIVTNGLNHYVCKIDYVNNGYEFLENIPDYHEISR